MSFNETNGELSRVSVICLPFSGAGASISDELSIMPRPGGNLAPQMKAASNGFADPHNRNMEQSQHGFVPASAAINPGPPAASSRDILLIRASGGAPLR